MNLITPAEETQLKQANSVLTQTVTIERLQSDDPHNAAYELFCNQINRIAPKIVITPLRIDPAPTAELRLKSNVRYRMLPTGQEFAPFLTALTSPQTLVDQLNPAIADRLQDIQQPAHFKLFVAPQCMFCPVTVRQMLGMALVNPSIVLTVIDGTLYPEATSDEAVKSVPTLIIDGQYRWTGTMDLAEIIGIIAERDVSRLSADYFKGIIEEGGAKEVARMMITDNALYPAFVDLLTHETWPVRLGAMVTLEYIAAEQIALARQIIAPLWQRFQTAIPQAQGDILYIFGETGGDEAIRCLREVLEGSFSEEVRQAAQEALENVAAG